MDSGITPVQQAEADRDAANVQLAAALNVISDVRRYARNLRDYAATIDDDPDESGLMKGIAGDVLRLVEP